MNLRAELRQFITDNFLLAGSGLPLSDSESMTARGILDSTGALELVLHLEECYGIRVLDEELHPDNLDSIERIAAYVERKCADALRPEGDPSRCQKG